MKPFPFLFGPMRVPFLLLTPACVAVGVATAYRQTGHLSLLDILIVLIGALAAHISVNVFNEYYDFKSGLDSRTQRTPFSGGSGSLQAHPEMARATLILAWASFAVTALVGLYFVWKQGWGLLPLGILGLVILVTYTLWFVYQPVLCLIVPGLGFGILMVMGTHYALTGTYTWTAFIASLVPTFLVSNLLLLNQFPDVEADQSVGRRHYPIVLGRRASSVVYGLFLLGAYLAVGVGVALRLLPWTSLLALLTLVLSWKAFRGAFENAENIPALIPSMGMNVIINLATPVLLALGLFLA
ncbi:prenyltransferase [Anaerolinea thermophila]|uniref:Prenyltransferase n=2 Tax=Anaerolinea TaxID=233189 RepID=E8N0Y3_ANATU|nr:prenyltransferase [Anaerolinea thermophila]BAJ62528.1 putative prenyltransferase [Anaerolinea thermophila UNI-1]